MVSLGKYTTGLREKMAETNTFNTFLFAAAVAGVSIGGTWMLANRGDDRETVARLATLTTKVENLTGEVSRLNNGLSTVLVLSVRVDNTERVLDRQQEALEELRRGRVPSTTREFK